MARDYTQEIGLDIYCLTSTYPLALSIEVWRFHCLTCISSLAAQPNNSEPARHISRDKA